MRFFSLILASCAVLLFGASLNAQTLSIDDSVQTFSTLTNTVVTMTGKSELHITGKSSPIAGSSINLNSKDSWLWFDNIRPGTVNSTYLSQIRVNGAAAVHGTNVRVVQYGMGTVVIPFTGAEQPLETFTGTGFTGESKLYSLYTYYNSASELGSMYKNISSFKLKRGYMATFATQTNGSGTSKVYIAQDYDLNIASLPSGLTNNIQFVRVFPWRWVSKKGSCDVSADKLNATWFYNWNNDQNSTLNWEYVPIRQQRYWPSLPTNKTSVTHLSGFNEPDNSVEDSYASLDNGSVDSAIAAWPDLLSTGLRVGSPAVTDGGKSWLYSFMDKANAAGLRVDYITIHFYSCGYSASALKSWLQDIWDRYHKPIWVTEFNNGANWTSCADPTYQQEADVINSWIDMMDSTPWIERYAVYSNVEQTRNMVYNEGGLTPAGTVYYNQQSPIGYQQESYSLAVDRGVMLLPFDGNMRDISGYGNGGVSYGSPVFTTGQKGQSLDLDGSNRYVQLPPGIAASNSFTFAAWVYWGGGSDNQRIFDFGDDTSKFMFLTPSTGGKLRFGIKNGSAATAYIETGALPSGSWQHVAVTMQGTTATIYVNGVQQASGTISTSTVSGTAYNYLGKSQWPSDPLFTGRLDEVVLADSAWSQAQVAAAMTSGSAVPFRSHWKGGVDPSWSTNNSGTTNWTNGDDSAAAGQIPQSYTQVVFSGAGANLGDSTQLGEDFSIKGLFVKSSSNAGIGGSHALTLGNRGIVLQSGSGALTIDTTGQLVLGASQTWTNNSGNPITVNSVVSGSGSLSKDGTGALLLGAANSYTGTTTLWNGTLALGNDAALSTGTVDLRGGALQSADSTSRTISNPLSLSADIAFNGTGNLKFTGATNAGSLSKTFTVNNAQTEFSGPISGSGARVKDGPGMLVFSGANTYTGATTLKAGLLKVNGSIASGSAVSVAADASLGGTGSVLGSTTFADNARFQWELAANSDSAGKLSMGPVKLTDDLLVDLVFNGPGSTTDFTDPFWSQARTWTILSSSNLTGKAATLGNVSADTAGRLLKNYGKISLQQTAAGIALNFVPFGANPPATPTILTWASLPGKVTISWTAVDDVGGYKVERATTSGGPYIVLEEEVVGTAFTDSSVVDGTTYYYRITAVNPNGESPPTTEIMARPHLASILDKADNSIDLNQTTSWATGIVPQAFDKARWVGLPGASSAAPGANASWNGIVVAATGGPVSIAAGQTLTIGTGGIDMSAATQNLSVSSGLQLGVGSQNWTIASGRTFTLGGALARSTGSTVVIDKSTHQGTVAAAAVQNAGGTGIVGPWAVVRSPGSAANNAAGGYTYATVSGGSLVPFIGATASGFNWTSTNGNTFNYDVSATTSALGISRSANTVRYTGTAGTQNYGNSSTASLTLNGLLNAGSGTLTFSQSGGSSLGQVVIGTNNGNELDLVAASAAIAIAIPILNTGTTPGSVVVAGPNAVTLSGANTFTGGLFLNSGTLLAGNAAVAGTGVLSLNGGTFGTTGTLTLSNPVNVSGTNIIGHTGQTASMTFSGDVSGTGTLKNGLVASADANVFFTGDMSGFSGTIDYTSQSGGTTLRWRVGTAGSTVNLSSASLILRIGDVTNSAASGRHFGFRDGITGATLKVGALSGDGVFQASYNNSGPNTLEVGHLDKSTTFSGVLAGGASGGNLNFVKIGSGTLTLSGTSPYTGTTTISEGTLSLTGVLSGNSSVSILSGGTLSGTGRSSGPVSVAGGGALAPGVSTGGVLTLSSTLSFADGGIFNVGIGTNSSRIALAGAFAADGVSVVNVRALTGFGPGVYPLISGATTSIDAANFILGSTPDGYSYSLSASGGTLALTILPQAPAGLTATGGNSSVALSWTAAPGAAGYTVKRAGASGGEYTVVATGVNATSYLDTGLSPGTIYYYVVSAASGAGESADSNEASATALSPSEAWRKTNFGTPENSGLASDMADVDQDGLTNMFEYALGSDPHVVTPEDAPKVVVADGKLTLSFQRNIAATDVVLTILGTDDVNSGEWEELARSSGGTAFTDVIHGTPSGVTITETGAGTLRSVVVHDAFPADDPARAKRFLKLQVDY